MGTQLHHKHAESPSKNSDLLRDVAIGMSDGLTVPFALAVGLSGAVDKSSIIVIAGFAMVAAGSIAMALGGYMAGKTERDQYQPEFKKEQEELRKLRHREIEDIKTFLANLGLSTALQEQATQEIAEDKDRWVEFLMKYELGLNKPDPQSATRSAINIGISYVAGGIIPLSPYFFIADATEALKYAVAATLTCLFIFGFFKSKMNGVNPFWGALKQTLIGAIAAAAAFGVAKLFDAQ